ncbi:MAG: protein-disulfide reductase DsbD N-terminal domain-containing protein [Betaproteobacteria bacterium]
MTSDRSGAAGLRISGAVFLCLAFSLARAASPADLLEAERAFAFSVRALDARTLEAHFAVAPGYYLYRDKVRFTVEPGALANTPVLPPGEIKHDEFFGRVATYRGKVVVTLPLEQPAPGQEISVIAESQGCADIGVCYPPQRQRIVLPLPRPGAAPGPIVSAVAPKRAWFR